MGERVIFLSLTVSKCDHFMHVEVSGHTLLFIQHLDTHCVGKSHKTTSDFITYFVENLKTKKALITRLS